MDYQEFLSQLCEKVKEHLPEGHQSANVDIVTSHKNNDTKLEALIIKNEHDTLVPRIYVDSYFEDEENGRSIENIAKEMVQIYLDNKTTQFKSLPEDITDYNKIKDQLVVQLINRDYNKELLTDVPHKDLENTDLSAILRLEFETDDPISAFARIDYQMLDLWKVSFDTAYEEALSNCIKKNPATIVSIEDVMMDIMGIKEVEKGLPKTAEIESYQQYVLSNSSGKWGATVMLYPEVLQQIAENSDADLLIMPSSIHEVILMKVTEEFSASELQSIVISVNQGGVLEPEDILSNGVYCYNKDEHMLSLATSQEETKKLGNRFSDQKSDFTSEMDDLLER